MRPRPVKMFRSPAEQRMTPFRPIRGLIFDLDGTLVDSGLDFPWMKREMGLPPGQPILESVESLDEPRRGECWRFLEAQEEAGARRATLMPGVTQFLAELEARYIRRAVLTRNSRSVTLATLARFDLRFDPIVTREDGPVKPDPSAIWEICKAWELATDEVALIGDFVHDIEAGRRAGVRTVLYDGQRELSSRDGTILADQVLLSFEQSAQLLRWLEQPA